MAWSQEQLSNANTIIQVGHQVGASDRDIVIALMAAMQESTLRNLNYGDRDSIGLFQQRDAWGSRAERLDPAKAARMFYLGGHAGQRGLLDFHNRDQMSLGQAAQSVQVSAFPGAYSKWEDEARGLAGNPNLPSATGDPGQSITSQLGAYANAQNNAIKDYEHKLDNQPQQGALDEVTSQGGPLDAVTFDANEPTDDGLQQKSALGAMNFDNAQPMEDPMAKLHMPSLNQFVHQNGLDMSTTAGWRKAVVAYARKFLGTPYVWGGTSPSGFDCSGLIQYVFKQVGHSLPRISADQARAGHRVGLHDLQAGDLVAWDNSSRNHGADHIALYIGNGMVIEAPRPGENVQISHIYDQGQAWGVHFDW